VRSFIHASQALFFLLTGESKDDPSFLEIVGSHLDLHAVTGENADPVEPHAAGEVTEELVLFSIGEHDANAKGRIRKALFHAADKLNDLLAQSKCGKRAKMNVSWWML
jgi:hypothetical protein